MSEKTERVCGEFLDGLADSAAPKPGGGKKSDSAEEKASAKKFPAAAVEKEKMDSEDSSGEKKLKACAKTAAIKGLTKKIKQMAGDLKQGRKDGSLSHVEQAVVAKHIKILQMALKALKKGDVELLKKAQQELMKSLEELRKKQQQTMIVLLETHGARRHTASRGCPYCKASCFEECHKKGKTYVVCLKKCAKSSE